MNDNCTLTPPSLESDKSTTFSIAWIWLLSRILVFSAAFIGSLRAAGFHASVTSYLHVWFRWDTAWFDSIAQQGYAPSYSDTWLRHFEYNVAFFPGFPLLMRVGSTAGLGTTAAGLIISFIAGFIAALALGRLAKQMGGMPHYAVLAWVAAPVALFLAAAYTEALFCAFAFWAWSLGREQRWIYAGMLGAAAALVRVNGVFLGVGLVVMFLTTPQRNWKRGSALLLPFVATAGYFAYLHAITGSWSAWSQAQSLFWKRQTVDPVTSLFNTFHRVIVPVGSSSASSPWRFVFEIVAMAVVVVAIVVAIRWKWWAELTYLFVTALSLGTSSVYLSVPRSLVVLFPIWLMLGIWMTRYRWVRFSYLIICVPWLIFWTIRFTQGFWVS
jgi:hypothetical protein